MATYPLHSVLTTPRAPSEKESPPPLSAGLRGCQRLDPLEKLLDANSHLFPFPPQCNELLLVCLNHFDSFPGFRPELFEILSQSEPLRLGLLEKLEGLEDPLFEFLQLIFRVAQEASSFQNSPRDRAIGSLSHRAIGSSGHWIIGSLSHRVIESSDRFLARALASQ